MAWLGQILTTSESCRPKYSNQLLLTKLNFLVHNPPLHTLYDNDGLQDGNTNFCGSKYKNKTFCGDNKLSSKPDARYSLLGCFNGTTKSFLSNLDDDKGVTTERNINQVQENGVSMENEVNPGESNPNLDAEDSKAHATVNGIIKMVQQKEKLHAKMRNLKQKMNTSDKMLKKQRRLLHQFQHIERRNKQHWKKNHTSYGKSIDYLAESPILGSKMKQIKEHKKNKHNKKKNFLSIQTSC